MKKIYVFISCSFKKEKEKAKAVELYSGLFFRRTLNLIKYLNMSYDDLFIMSGKHSLINANTVIEKYEQILTNKVEVSLKDFKNSIIINLIPNRYMSKIKFIDTEDVEVLHPFTILKNKNTTNVDFNLLSFRAYIEAITRYSKSPQKFIEILKSDMNLAEILKMVDYKLSKHTLRDREEDAKMKALGFIKFYIHAFKFWIKEEDADDVRAIIRMKLLIHEKKALINKLQKERGYFNDKQK